MKLENFAYWLQGYFEIHNSPSGLTKEQVDTIKSHLALVFYHDIDPKAGNQQVQDELNHLHNSKPDADGIVYRC